MLQSSQTVMDLLSHCGHNSELHLKEMRNTKPHHIQHLPSFPQNFWLFWILMLDFWGGWGWDPSLHDSCSVNKNPIKLISGRRKICDVMNAKHFFYLFLSIIFLIYSFLIFLIYFFLFFRSHLPSLLTVFLIHGRYFFTRAYIAKLFPLAQPSPLFT